MKKCEAEIRESAIRDHLSGERPFATEYFERQKVEGIKVKPVDCRHCDSTGYCVCRMCNLGRTSEPTPCSICQWGSHRAWLEATRPAHDYWAVERENDGNAL